MNSEYSQTALIGPYTLMEDEALAWSIILFKQTLLLHPFPLPLPQSYQPLVDQGWLQVRSPSRSPGEIRQKDKKLREIETFISEKPDQGILKYLKEASLLADQETQEELVGILKGEPYSKGFQQNQLSSGSLLLCLIHDWILQEWAVEAALVDIEEQEKQLTQSWQEGLEEGPIGSTKETQRSKRNEMEIPCPLALQAWKELKSLLVPEPVFFFTSQPWVWKNYYGTDWEESQATSLVLPDLGFSAQDFLQPLWEEALIQEHILLLRETWEGILRDIFLGNIKQLEKKWPLALSALKLPNPGRYQLVLPFIRPGEEGALEVNGLKKVESLILITPQ